MTGSQLTLGKTCLTSLWIPDGVKDTPTDRKAPRERLAATLDAGFTSARLGWPR